MIAWWKNLQLEYDQTAEFHDLKREILDYQIYGVELESQQPVIIDGGAHLGLATAYFKWLYPEAHLWAFEPNPDLYRLLQKNIQANDFEDVTVINAALSSQTGKRPFFVDDTDWRWYSVGSFRRGAWSGEQKRQREIIVKTVKLSDFVQKMSTVDLLKLDIEGAEMSVLLSLKNQLQRVKNLVFEFHPTPEQNFTQLCQLLRGQGYELTLKDRKNKPKRSWRPGELILVEARR